MKREDVPHPIPISQRRPLDTMTSEEIWLELLGDGLYAHGFDPVRLEFAFGILCTRWKKKADPLFAELNGQLREMGSMDVMTKQMMLTAQQGSEGMI